MKPQSQVKSGKINSRMLKITPFDLIVLLSAMAWKKEQESALLSG